MSTPRIEIVVDELLVRGLTPPEARVVAAALEARLALLAGAGGAQPSGRPAESFRRLPSVEASSPAGIGDAVAGAVWRGVGGGGRR
jgi:hypothetical protein